MAAYIGRRLLQLPATVGAAVLVAFALIQLAPGDPIAVLAGEQADESVREALRAKFGLDKPLHEQAVAYAGQVVRLDLGMSRVYGRPVADVIGERIPATLLLTGTALSISTVLGIGLGVVAARRGARRLDGAISVATLALHATPVFWLAQLSMLVFGLHLGLFPVHGMATPGGFENPVVAVADVLRHLFLPALALGATEIAAITGTTRAALLDELAHDYVRTARAYGFRERTILLRLALRRALLPVLTLVGARAGYLLGGAAIVETVFAWPGLGRLSVVAAQSRDAPTLLGILLVVVVTVTLANLATDLLYGWLDPRIRRP